MDVVGCDGCDSCDRRTISKSFNGFLNYFRFLVHEEKFYHIGWELH